MERLQGVDEEIEELVVGSRSRVEMKAHKVRRPIDECPPREHSDAESGDSGENDSLIGASARYDDLLPLCAAMHFCAALLMVLPSEEDLIAGGHRSHILCHSSEGYFVPVDVNTAPLFDVEVRGDLSKGWVRLARGEQLCRV
jgi:hypothetical protein